MQHKSQPSLLIVRACCSQF